MIPIPHLARIGLAFAAFGAGAGIFEIARDYWNHQSASGFEFAAVIALVLCILVFARIGGRRQG